MTTSDRDERVLMLLGELKAGLAAVRDDIAEIKKEATDDRHDTAESRRRVYEKLEDGDRRLTEVESTVRVLGGVLAKQTARIDALEPTVKSSDAAIRLWMVRAGMIAGAFGLVGTVLWSLLGSNWAAIWGFVQTLLRQP